MQDNSNKYKHDQNKNLGKKESDFYQNNKISSPSNENYRLKNNELNNVKKVPNLVIGKLSTESQ